MTLLTLIPILLTLGSQPECDGFGMCILEQQTEAAIAECSKYENCIRADMDYEDKELILTVTEHKINDKAFIKYFTKEYFDLDKDFVINETMAEAIGCPPGTVIEKGKYPINEEGGKIVVRFKL
jgi:hypothetical protein